MAGGRRDIEAGSAYVRVFMKKTELERGLIKLRRNLQNIGAGFTRAGAMFAAAGGAIVGTIAKAVSDFAGFGDQLDKMAARTGVSVKALSELKFAAEQSGASIEDVGAVIQKMNRRVGRVTAGQGTDSQVKALEELGVSIEELRAMNPEQRFLAIADAMANYGDEAAAAGLAQRAFGTGVDKLLPLIFAGRNGIEELREEARELGLTMSEDDAKAAAAFTDAMNRMKRAAEAAWHRIGIAVAPVLESMIEKVTEFAKTAQAWIDEHRNLVVAMLKVGFAIGAVGIALTAIGTAFSVAAIAVKGFTLALWVLTAHPIVAAITAVAAVVGGVAAVIYLATRRTEDLAAKFESAAKSGKKLQDVTGGAGGGGEIKSPDEDPAAFTRGLAERLHQVRLQMIEDEERRQLEAIRRRHAAEMEAAREEGRIAAEIAALRQTQIVEEEALRVKFQKEREQRQKDFQKDLTSDIEELRIRASKEGLEEELGILELEKRREIEAAKKLHPGKTWRSASGALIQEEAVVPPEVLAQIEEKYGLKEALAREMYQTAQTAIGPSGTFSTAAAAAMAGAGQDAQERSARSLERAVTILDNIAGLSEEQRDAIKAAFSFG